jgi:hypothetical protein
MGNLILNPSFEEDLGYWTIPATNITKSMSVEQALYGTHSLKLIASAADTQTCTSDKFPVKELTDYALTFSYYTPVTASISATATISPLGYAINYYDSSSALLSTYTPTTTISICTNYWAEITDSNSTSPANAKKANVQISSIYDTVGQTVYLDGIQFEPATATPFEQFDYYLDDPDFPELIPPTLWDKREFANSIILVINNAYGFTLNEDLIRESVLKIIPAHVKVYFNFLSVADSLLPMIWDESMFDEAYWS